MKRNIGAERLYNLGQYKNIRLLDTIDNIPERHWKNQELMESLYFYLLLTVEQNFRRYIKLNEEIGPLSLEEAMARLDEMRGEQFAKIKELLTNGDTKNGNIENATEMSEE